MIIIALLLGGCANESKSPAFDKEFIHYTDSGFSILHFSSNGNVYQSNFYGYNEVIESSTFTPSYGEGLHCKYAIENKKITVDSYVAEKWIENFQNTTTNAIAYCLLKTLYELEGVHFSNDKHYYHINEDGTITNADTQDTFSEIKALPNICELVKPFDP